mmetsp:Transcript_46302/g.53361  ORF Transcript_46302/g.53361 Transcript_46302/m.53361 type:complete len:107 (-) Transcript_46302:175-495(-)
MADASGTDLKEIRKWMQAKHLVKYTDMEADLLTDAQEAVISCLDSCSGASGLNIEAAAKKIKEEMDKKTGPYWHCAIGEGFSFDVTSQCILYMYYGGQTSVILFKC